MPIDLFPFVMFAECSIRYSGRAESTLERGNYLIVKKTDGAIIIHGATRYRHLNYQSSGAKLQFNGKQIISLRKKERIEIKVYQIYHSFVPENWSDTRIRIRFTEQELKNYIARNIETILGKKIKRVILEYDTLAGPVDIVAIEESNIHNIIEVKRGKALLSACSQLERYIKSITANQVVGWIMSPEVTKGCLEYCQKHDLHWKKVDFQR